MRFASVTDPTEYRELLRDPAVASVWYLGRPSPIDGASREAYELVQFAVNGRLLPIPTDDTPGAQTYSANVPADTCRHSSRRLVCLPCSGQATWASAVPRRTAASQGPARRVRLRRLRHPDARWVDFIAGAQQARVLRTPESDAAPSVVLNFDGWVFPKSGVAFVWSLDAETKIALNHRA